MKTKLRILVLVFILTLAVAGLALANGSVAFPRWVLSGGASDSASGEVTLRAAFGEPVVGIVSGEEVSLKQGFWHGGVDSPPGRVLYLPIIQR